MNWAVAEQNLWGKRNRTKEGRRDEGEATRAHISNNILYKERWRKHALAHLHLPLTSITLLAKLMIKQLAKVNMK